MGRGEVRDDGSFLREAAGPWIGEEVEQRRRDQIVSHVPPPHV